MDDRIAIFLDSLKKGLAGLPEDEASEALGYYGEFLSDAQDEGKDLDEVLGRLDPPDKIAAVIKAGTNIRRAESSPGFVNFNRAMKNALLGISAPITIVFTSIFVLISYCVVITFLAGAFAFFLGAIVASMAAFYEAFKIPVTFLPEMVGTFGTGLLAGGLFLLISLCLYRLSKIFIRFSARLILKAFKRKDAVSGFREAPAMKETRRGRRLFLAFSIVALLGLVMFSVSGLPYKFFVIFNSMKPEKINMTSRDFDTAGINKISIISAHSCIEVGYQDTGTNKITVSYEQPDWLDYKLSSSGSMLSFYENSNGRLPFFSLDTMHESRTEIKVLLPKGYSPDVIELESRGGFITVDGLDENIKVKTYTGKISLNYQGTNVNIEASTETGRIGVAGVNTGNTTQRGIEYYRHVDSNKTVVLMSSRGDIDIQ